MDFLLSPEGLLYNASALALLAYLLWQRPIMGVLLAALAGVRVFGPILGAGQWIPFSVHMTLAVVSATAYRKSSPSHSLALAIGAAIVTAITAYFYFVLWNRPTVFWRGVLAGGLLRGAYWLLLWALTSSQNLAASSGQ